MKFLSPKNLNEALKLKSDHPDFTVLAGGTDACTLINSDILKPKGLINILGIKELSEIKENGDFLEIGALVTHTKIIESRLVSKFLPALATACRTVGARQIQNRGTIGGNVMNASPAGDTLPVLMAYETKIELSSAKGSRLVSFEKFYLGYRKTAAEAFELAIKFIIKKADDKERSTFMKVGTRRAQAISKVCACFRRNSSYKIAYGSVAPIPIRCPVTEKFLTGKNIEASVIGEAVRLVRQEVSPMDDIRSTANYRRHVAGVLLNRFLESLSEY